MRLTLVTLVLVGLVVGALPAADAFAAGPYRGRVIDAETREPLAGAVVLVYWIRNAPAIGHGPAESFLGAEEALTDDRGEFIVAENPPSNWIPSHVAQPAQLHHLPARLRLLPEALRDHAAPAPDRIRGLAEDHGEATRRLRAAPADDAGRSVFVAHCRLPLADSQRHNTRLSFAC